MQPERRRFPRTIQSLIIRYRPFGELDDAWVEATAVNLSAGGMRVRTDTPTPADTPIELELSLPGSKDRFTLQGRTVWHKLLAAGVIECGIEFLDITPIQQQQIDAFVQFFH